MDRVDVVIIIALIYVVYRGMKVGFLQLVGSTLGLVGGLLLGSWLSVKVTHGVGNANDRLLLIVLTEGVLAIGFSYLFGYLGFLLGNKLHKRSLQKTNKLLGAPFEALALLLIVWVVASGIANVQAYSIGYYTQHSLIVKELDEALPPPPDFFARLEKIVSPNGFPNVFIGIEPQHTSIPTNSYINPQTITTAENSIVKVVSFGCGGLVQGSGVVVASNMVVTNAHVVAGTTDSKVSDKNGVYSATPIWFDPNLDISVLRVNGLHDNPLVLSAQTVNDNSSGVVLGYPGNGPLVADNAVVLDEIVAEGQNIYNRGTVDRNIYELQSDIEPGNSGGALIDADGTVIGIVFAKSVSQPNIGYALVSSDIINSVQTAEKQNTPVSVGQCAD